MPISLSKRCKKVAEILFPEPRRSQIMTRLVLEASENIPFHENKNSAGMDRVRFSIMKLAAMPNADDNYIFNLAKTDWRDLFVGAGFGYAADDHDKWYEKLILDH